MPIQTRQADLSVQQGHETFRLFQGVQSSGDIFEVNASSKAFCVGPQSDLCSYRLSFFDKQAGNNIEEMDLAVGNPIIGRTDAKLATSYPLTALPARILVTPNDLVDNAFLPTAFTPANLDFVFARPLPFVDIISYLSEPAGFAPGRADRTFFYPFITVGIAPQAVYFILPYYGRRYANISVVNRNTSGVLDYTLDVLGVNLSAGTTFSAPAGRSKASEKTLGVLSAAAGVTDDLVITAAADGMFDLLSIRLTAAGAILDEDSTLRIVVSDRI